MTKLLRRRRLALRWRIALFVIGPLVVFLSLFGVYDASVQRQTREADLLQKGRILAVTGAQTASSLFEDALASGRLSREQLFDTNYVPIPGTKPQKYHTAYDAFTDAALQKIEDQFQADSDVVFAIAVDRNGYVPTHNTNYSNASGDPILYRTKQLFNDPTGLAAGQTSEFLQQVYVRDTGEKMWDLDAPITVEGQHWGGFRVGFSMRNVSAQVAETTRTIALSLAGVLLLLALIAIVVADRLAAPMRRLARAAQQLAVGDVEQRVDIRRDDEIGDMADAVRAMIDYQHRLAAVAGAVAENDLAATITPASARDVLGRSFVKMIGNLRAIVEDVQHSANTLAETSARLGSAIAELIQEVQGGTREAVEAMELGSAKVEQGSERAAQAGAALDEILRAVETTVRQVTSIATAAQEMSAAAHGVTGAMQSISGVVEENTAATEEMAAQAGEVSSAMQGIAAVSEEQNAATEDVSASAEEMTAQVEEMSAQAEELAATAARLRSVVARFRLDLDGAEPEATVVPLQQAA